MAAVGPAVWVLPRIPGKGVPADLRRAIDARIRIEPVWKQDQWTTGTPDFYLARASGTKEPWQANRLGIVYVVYLPETAEWLGAEVMARITAGSDVYIYQRQQSGVDYPW